MKGSFKLRIGSVAAVLLVAAFATRPASASIGAGPFTGSGTMSPGLTATGGLNTFTFSGSGVIVSDSAETAIDCVWNGADYVGTYTQGAGSFAGTCSNGDPYYAHDDTVTFSITGDFTRTLDVMTVNAVAVAQRGGVSGFLTGVCEWTPTSWGWSPSSPTLPAMQSYYDVCDYTID